MALQLKAGFLAVTLCALSGCATVSVYETTKVADISLTSGQDNLEKSSRSFHKTIRHIGVEETNSAFDIFSSWFGDEADDSDAYWRRVKADNASVATVRESVSSDVALIAAKLVDVNDAAEELVKEAAEGGAPTKQDVTDVENVLISVRYARNAFCDALEMANTRTSMPINIDLVMTSLDLEIDRAAKLADELAAARMSGALSLASIERI